MPWLILHGCLGIDTQEENLQHYIEANNCSSQQESMTGHTWHNGSLQI